MKRTQMIATSRFTVRVLDTFSEFIRIEGNETVAQKAVA